MVDFLQKFFMVGIMDTIQTNTHPLRYGFAGFLTTAVSVPVVHPLYTVCTFLVTEKNPWKILMPLNRLNWRILYRGMAANGYCDLSGQVAAFLAYGHSQNQSLGDVPSAVSAGIAAAPVFNAWDRIMTIQQITGNNMRQTARLINLKEGRLGLFKGTSWTLFQECFYQSFFFSISNQLADRLSKNQDINPLLGRAICYSTTGLAIGAITSPIQYVRTLVHKELGAAKAAQILPKTSRAMKVDNIVQLAKLRTPLLGMNMLIAGFAKDFFLNI